MENFSENAGNVAPDYGVEETGSTCSKAAVSPQFVHFFVTSCESSLQAAKYGFILQCHGRPRATGGVWVASRATWAAFIAQLCWQTHFSRLRLFHFSIKYRFDTWQDGGPLIWGGVLRHCGYTLNLSWFHLNECQIILLINNKLNQWIYNTITQVLLFLQVN